MPSPPIDADALSRLVLAYPSDTDRWAGAVARTWGWPASVGRDLARRVALAGDSPITRLEGVAPLQRGTRKIE